MLDSVPKETFEVRADGATKGWVAGAERPEWLKTSLRSGHVEITENLGMVLVVRAGKAPVSSFEVEAYALVFAEGRWRDC